MCMWVLPAGWVTHVRSVREGGTHDRYVAGDDARRVLGQHARRDVTKQHLHAQRGAEEGKVRSDKIEIVTKSDVTKVQGEASAPAKSEKRTRPEPTHPPAPDFGAGERTDGQTDKGQTRS